MESLDAYVIPIFGLKDGIHQFNYKISEHFFEHFPASPITKGNFDVNILFDKKPRMIDIKVEFNGFINAACDRCLEEFSLPVNGQERLLLKYSDDFKEEADIVYIPFDTATWNIAKYIFEFICLSIPLIKTHDLSPEENCDEQMLSYLNSDKEENSNINENPIWDSLKDIKF